jgi:hypothetical protein
MPARIFRRMVAARECRAKCGLYENPTQQITNLLFSGLRPRRFSAAEKSGPPKTISPNQELHEQLHNPSQLTVEEEVRRLPRCGDRRRFFILAQSLRRILAKL